MGAQEYHQLDLVVSFNPASQLCKSLKDSKMINLITISCKHLVFVGILKILISLGVNR